MIITMTGIFSSMFSILVTIFIFGLLIFIHELGHYIVARRCKVGIIEFAIGMGPKIYSWEGKVNTFSLRLLPIGGFVSMVGEYSDEIAEKDRYKTPLEKIAVWKRMLIAIAGPTMNILLGFLVMAILVVSGKSIYSTTIAKFADGAKSSEYGLMVGDQIIEINDKNIHVYTDLSYKIVSDGIKPLDITVLRNGEEITLHDVQFPTEVDKGVSYGIVDFGIYAKEKTIGSVLHQSFYQSVSTIYMTVDSLIDAIKGRYGADSVSGPVGIGSQIGDVIDEGIQNPSIGFWDTVRNLMTILVFISVSLGIFNLLPIPVLDGGMILICLIEIIRRKPMNKELERAVTAVFMVLLLTATVLIFFKDLINLF